MLMLRRQKVWAKTQQCWCTCRAADTRAADRRINGILRRHRQHALQRPANGHALPPALAAHPARRGCLARAPQSQVEHGAASTAWLGWVLDMRRRLLAK